jgi:glycosyltransferase involved in cell wall biosynthesis
MKNAEKSKKVVIVMPGYNVARTIKRTVDDIPKGLADEIILVDDGSWDDTSRVGEDLGLTVVRHKKNKGYGAAQKTGYKKALKMGADIVIMLHPDYQYDPRLSEELVSLIKKGVADIMLGTRIRTRKEVLEGGMPVYKYLSNRFLTILENIVLGQNLGEYHTGFRAYTKEALKKVKFNNFSDDFVFDGQMLVAAAYKDLIIGEIPVPVKYFAEASSISFIKSLKYGLETLILLVKFLAAKTGVYKSKIFN